ncbi:MAG TPA: sulfate adenylyltransferase [Thermoplasmata archaeon]|nr:sulfate adenylyltransferase [Thermoplasmata archaeon]
MIPAPHGGRLIDRRLSPAEVERRDGELRDLPKLRPELGQVYDAEKLGVGAYSPLDGFMDQATVEGVVTMGRLPNGLPWPIPIYLSPPGPENARVIAQLRPDDEVAILDAAGNFVALLHVQDRFPLPRAEIARHVFDTTDPRHPDIAGLALTGDVALGGKVDLLRPPPFPIPSLELTPAAAREMFRSKGWRSVAGYQTRNVPHLGHEQLQRLTLERSDIDAVFIHPVVGPLKPGDYQPEVVVAAYRALIDGYYPAGRVALATLGIAMRYAGPRASIFLAIIRQNFGCSHFIVGRDQAGVGEFYEPYACHRIFDGFPLEIVPLRYRELSYCPACGGMVSDKTCGHPRETRVSTSQTKVRTALANRRPLPEEILRPEVVRILQGTDVIRPSSGPPADAETTSGMPRTAPPGSYAPLSAAVPDSY